MDITNSGGSITKGVMHPSILLQSGGVFDFLSPEKSRFTIDDIAHGLSNTCRYAGQTDRFYSVAQHSVIVSHLVSKDIAMHGLMHDAHEAFMGDVPSPLKALLPDYKRLECTAEVEVLRRFALEIGHDIKPMVKHADLVALATEKRDLMPFDGGLWSILEGISPSINKIVPLDPPEAKELFLGRYWQLKNV